MENTRECQKFSLHAGVWRMVNRTVCSWIAHLEITYLSVSDSKFTSTKRLTYRQWNWFELFPWLYFFFPVAQLSWHSLILCKEKYYLSPRATSLYSHLPYRFSACKLASVQTAEPYVACLKTFSSCRFGIVDSTGVRQWWLVWKSSQSTILKLFQHKMEVCPGLSHRWWDMQDSTRAEQMSVFLLLVTWVGSSA